MNRNRVVITGLGAVTALGPNVPTLWEGLLQGKSGIRRITQFDATAISVPDRRGNPRIRSDTIHGTQGGAPFPTLRPDRIRSCRPGRTASWAVHARCPIPSDQVSSSAPPSGALNELTKASIPCARKVSIVLTRSRCQPGSRTCLPFLISFTFKCLGPNTTITTACATGTQAVGEAAELIRRGAADVVITGGTEALIRDFAIGGFCAMRALPINFNDRPEAASRPFDA